MDGLAATIKGLLDEIQASLLERARTYRESHTTATTSYDEFKSVMEGRPGFVQSPWCGSAKCEADIKAETQATIRNIPFGFEVAPEAPCIKCNGPAVVTAWFAKAY
jgi:prolyl-tRNA synthetase